MPGNTPVERDQGQITAGSTLLLRPGDAVYLGPGKAATATKDGERTLRDLEALLHTGSAAIREVRDLEGLETSLLDLIGETIPAERGAILLTGDSPEEILSRGIGAGPRAM